MNLKLTPSGDSAPIKRDILRPKMRRKFFVKQPIKLIMFMRRAIPALLLVFFFLSEADNVSGQGITLKEKNITLENVFKKIEAQTDYLFFYTEEQLKKAGSINISVKDATIQQVMNLCLKGLPLSYSIKDKVIYIKENPSAPEVIADNYITAKGHIVNQYGEPVAGASVMLKKNQAKGTSTDEKGWFSLNDVEIGDVLVISGVNIQPQEIKVSGGNMKILASSKIALNKDIQVLAYTGYQAISKERATGAFESMGEKAINRRISPDILSRLEGVSSVYFDRRTGGQKISIRGRSTILANAEPLVIVDNFPYDGDIDNINPNDIENITLLKDAAAGSIWGARSGNGVIVITTKKGRYNSKPSLQFNSNITIGEKPDLYYYPTMTSKDFIEVEKFLFGKGYYNSTLNNTTRRPYVSPAVEILAQQRDGFLTESEADAQLQQLEEYDVRNDLKKYFYQNGINQQYAINYKGGTDKYNYYMSAGWDKMRSYEKGDVNSRLTLTTTNSFKPVKNLQILSTIAFSQNIGARNRLTTDLKPASKEMYPYARLVDENGNALEVAKDYRLTFLDTAGAGKLLDWKWRPLDELALADNPNQQNEIRINAGINYEFIQGLSLDVKYQYQYQNGNTDNYYSKETYYARNFINQFTQINGDEVTRAIPLGGILDRYNSQLFSHIGRAQLSINKNWNSTNEVNAIAGIEVKELHTKLSNYRTYGYDENILTYGDVNYQDLLPTYRNIAGNQKITNQTSFSDKLYRYASFFGNAAYILQNRYSISASVRYDASNLFGVNTNQKGVPLWSAGLGWELSREEFYHVDFLPHLKVRFTFGYNGNVDNTLSAYTTLRYYSNSALISNQYARMSTPGNPELRWEKTGMTNIGFDFGTYNNRFAGSLDYYTRRGADLIGEAPIDPTTGVTLPSSKFGFRGNVAKMKGNGVDIKLHYTTQTNSVIVFSSDLIFGYSKNKVTEYGIQATTASAFVGMGNLITPIVGKPLYSIFSYKWAGLDPENGNPRGYLDDEISINYSKISSSPPETLVFNGSAVPEIFGSLRNTVRFKNISLSVNIIYKLDYYFRRSTISYQRLLGNWITHADYTKRWQKAGDELNTTIPSMIYPNSSARDGFYVNSNELVERGDHIRVQDVSLSYRLGGRNQTKSIFKNIELYAYVNNIGILWKANNRDIDPDYYTTGFPKPRTYAIGVKANF